MNTFVPDPVYIMRGRSLLAMGYSSYREYLQSDLWAGVRARFFSCYKAKCYGCGGKATQIHHSRYTYLNLSGKSLQHMYAVCADCHRIAEQEGRAGIDVANRILAVQHSRHRKRGRKRQKCLACYKLLNKCKCLSRIVPQSSV